MILSIRARRFDACMLGWNSWAQSISCHTLAPPPSFRGPKCLEGYWGRALHLSGLHVSQCCCCMVALSVWPGLFAKCKPPSHPGPRSRQAANITDLLFVGGWGTPTYTFVCSCRSFEHVRKDVMASLGGCSPSVTVSWVPGTQSLPKRSKASRAKWDGLIHLQIRSTTRQSTPSTKSSQASYRNPHGCLGHH